MTKETELENRIKALEVAIMLLAETLEKYSTTNELDGKYKIINLQDRIASILAKES